MKKVFANLPAQAIKVALKGLIQIGPGTEWDAKAKTVFRFSEQDYWLFCRFYPRKNKKANDSILYDAILCDTHKKDNVYLSQVLINEKLAKLDINETSK